MKKTKTNGVKTYRFNIDLNDLPKKSRKKLGKMWAMKFPMTASLPFPQPIIVKGDLGPDFVISANDEDITIARSADWITTTFAAKIPIMRKIIMALIQIHDKTIRRAVLEKVRLQRLREKIKAAAKARRSRKNKK